MFSWYEVALRLRLPELIEQNRKDDSVLGNLVAALIKESSVRNRRTAEVTISGLAVMPRATVLPHLAVPEPRQSSPHTRPAPSKADEHRPKREKETPKPLIAKRMADTFGFSAKPAKPSAENWIPEDMRMRAIQRNIMFAKETLEGTMKLESNMAREMKRLMVSDLERAKVEETLDATRKLPCGCCTQDFLYVNLPMFVSRKAILDIRIKWSGQLNSSNVFRSTSFRELVEDRDSGHSHRDKDRGKKASSNNHASYDTVPQCYDQVGVCVFCTQFFQEPEDYRPSYAMITYEERRALHLEAKRKEREYWDPLKMVEDDRMRAEALAVLEAEQMDQQQQQHHHQQMEDES